MPVTECQYKIRSQEQTKDAEIKEAKGECLLFFVYRECFDPKVRNTIVKFSNRIKAYDGRILGVAKQVSVIGNDDSPWRSRSDWCVAAFVFPSQHLARFWFVSEPEVKQHDFPPPSDGFMVFSVPVRYIPKPGRMTFCWTEMSDIKDKSSYQTDYVEKVSTLFDSKGVNHGVVFLKDKEENQIDRLKDCWIKHGCHFRLDLYSSESEFWEIYESESYKPLREARDSLSETTNVIFTIEPKMCL